tara:strand:- start:438 stop:749 length:312 start_codon:yes stop_codon:yes gene_type:complete
MRHPPSSVAPAPYSFQMPDTLGPDTDILPTQIDEINKLGLDGAVPGEVSDGSLDPALATAGLAMMATPPPPDFAPVRRAGPYQRREAWGGYKGFARNKPFGEY